MHNNVPPSYGGALGPENLGVLGGVKVVGTGSSLCVFLSCEWGGVGGKNKGSLR